MPTLFFIISFHVCELFPRAQTENRKSEIKLVNEVVKNTSFAQIGWNGKISLVAKLFRSKMSLLRMLSNGLIRSQSVCLKDNRIFFLKINLLRSFVLDEECFLFLWVVHNNAERESAFL